ncbi:hypothetical protein Purlil1_13181 [Purpureocillium lilacinum]|uniref:Uncharacterized protein n=1 Tax=Purpureocillium lilacinum TaxID=33203 RepID=A0ABR0BEQ7_PURLI|nr:hypothetical protein Purlil1_13181 [Purpureocillium lilacinum]
MYLQRSQAKPSPSSILGFGARRTKERAVVAMVGDGVNDSPALTVADVGIAIGSGSDVAISAAEFVLIKSDLTTLLTLITLSRTVFRRVKFNFGWALVYNLIALPIAAGVLYPVISNGQHVRLDPVWASLAMALSSGGQAPAGDLAAETDSSGQSTPSAHQQSTTLYYEGARAVGELLAMPRSWSTSWPSPVCKDTKGPLPRPADDAEIV